MWSFLQEQFPSTVYKSQSGNWTRHSRGNSRTVPNSQLKGFCNSQILHWEGTDQGSNWSIVSSCSIIASKEMPGQGAPGPLRDLAMGVHRVSIQGTALIPSYSRTVTKKQT